MCSWSRATSQSGGSTFNPDRHRSTSTLGPARPSRSHPLQHAKHLLPQLVVANRTPHSLIFFRFLQRHVIIIRPGNNPPNLSEKNSDSSEEILFLFTILVCCCCTQSYRRGAATRTRAPGLVCRPPSKLYPSVQPGHHTQGPVGSHTIRLTQI